MATSPGRSVERAIRQAISAVFLLGFRWRNPGAIVNAVLAFGGTYVPDIVERAFDVEFHPWQRAYVGAAMFTHAWGMLGPYDDVWWWDHLTHTLSASVLGGFVFVSARRRGLDPRPRVLATVVGLGLLWELLEYAIHATADRLGLEPILVFYDRADTYGDLAFNVVGAVLVLVLGDRVLGNLAGCDGDPDER